MRRTLVVLLLMTSVLTIPNAAHAETHSGDPLSSVPPLLTDGAQYGTVSRTAVVTASNDDWSRDEACGTPGSHTQGAAVYRFAAPQGALVSVRVTELATAEALCKVELVRATSSSGTITDLYDPAARAAHLARASACPSTVTPGVACSMNWRLGATDTYYLVFWPAGDDTDVEYASFDAVTSVLRETTTTLGLSGFYAKVGSCYKVLAGKTLRAKAKVSPTTATGMTRFTLRKRNADGTYSVVGAYNRTLSGGYAEQSFAPAFGRYSVRATYLGNRSNAPSSSEARCFDVVANSTSRQKLSGYYSISADYFVYHGGDTITVTATVGPVPAGGSVRFRIEHENYDTSYSYFRHYDAPVVNGKAVLKFSVGYTSKWLPFYRVRSEYRGDAWHLPKNSAWNCFWIRK